MSSSKAFTEDEILKLLEDHSDIDEEEVEDSEIVYDVPKVQYTDAHLREREFSSIENVEDTDYVDLPIITPSELINMGLSVPVSDDIPSTSATARRVQFECTLKKNIRWRGMRVGESSDWNNNDTIFNPTASSDNIEIGSPYSYFQRYLPNEFFVDAAYYTNLYAQSKGNVSFKHCSVDEMRIVFAHHIMMGVLKFPRVEMFYDTSIGIKFFTENMARKRFFAIRNNLHLCDASDRDKNCKDRLYKVRPVIDLVRKRLLELPLEENLCVDEQIIPYKGKFAAKQYIKGKPCPWGIKVFFMCGKSGMPYDFIVYQGSTTSINEAWVKAFGFGAAVVLHLSQRIPESEVGHKLFFDNYFPSYQLFEVLKKKNIYAAGTIRINRFAKPRLPDEKEMKARGRGSSAECISSDGSVIITRWYDNKVINLGSNFVGVREEDQAKRWDKEKASYIFIKRPEVVRMYNESMGGVDLLDQMIQYYRINIRTVKWTLRVIMHFVDLALTAAWMEYRRDCVAKNIPKNNMLDSMHFRINVAHALLSAQNDEPPRPKRGRPKKSQTISDASGSDNTDDCEPTLHYPKKKVFQKAPAKEVRLDQRMHLPSFVSSKNAGRCKKDGCRKNTFVICTKCNVYLCVKRENNCFEQYHTNN